MYKILNKIGILILVLILYAFHTNGQCQVWTESVIDSFRTGTGVDSVNINFLSGPDDDGSLILSPASENFALSKNAWDNDNNASSKPELAIDGKTASPSFWASYTNQCVGTWITIDLEAKRTVERVNILGSNFEPHLKYIKGYSIDVSLDNNNWTRVVQNLDNTDWDVYTTFSPMTARYVRITIEKSDNNNWTIIGEIQVFGSGYASSGMYYSKIKNFGKKVNFGHASWQTTIPDETFLNLQFRSDSAIVSGEYYLVEDTVRLNNKYIMAGTEQITNSDGSVVYTRNLDYTINYEEGKVIRTQLSSILLGQEIRTNYQSWATWTSPSDASEGFLFQTLEPRQFLQYKVNFGTYSLETPVFSAISIEYSEQPVVQRATAMVSPKEVPVLKSSVVTYVIELESGANDLGIDTLKITTPAIAQLQNVRLDGKTVNFVDLSDPQENELQIYFPSGLEAQQSSLLEVDILITLFESENYFPALMVSSQTPNNPQFIEQGYDGWKVVTTGIPESPLVSVEAKPNPLSPNGDNVCDYTEIAFYVAKIAQSRHVKIDIYDLNGDLIRKLLDIYSGAKDFKVKWDGKDDWGQLALPGVYIFQVFVDTDSGEYITSKTVTVAY